MTPKWSADAFEAAFAVQRVKVESETVTEEDAVLLTQTAADFASAALRVQSVKEAPVMESVPLPTLTSTMPPEPDALVRFSNAHPSLTGMKRMRLE